MDKLNFTADDFGMRESANLGILRCIEDNLINSVSVCVNYGLRKVPPLPMKNSLQVGLHLNVTEGVSLSNAQPLISGDRLMGAQDQIHQSIPKTCYEKEFQAQLDRFIFLFGRLPQYIDCHQYFSYVVPQAFLAMVLLCCKKKIPMRSPLPFIDKDHLTDFSARVRLNHSVQLTFDPYIRSQELYCIFSDYNPPTRTRKITLDFPHSQELKGEVVCHPILLDLKRENADILRLRKVRSTGLGSPHHNTRMNSVQER